MSLTLDPVAVDLAKGVQAATANSLGGNGLDYRVVLAQWEAEQQGAESVKNWYYFNPAGITPGNSYVDKLSIGTKQGFDTFPTAFTGAQAYAQLYIHDPAYSKVREAIKTGDPKKQMEAIAASPWAGSHYSKDGVQGGALFSIYNEITGAGINPDKDPNEVKPQDGSPEMDNLHEHNNSQFRSWLGIPSTVGAKEIGIVLVGSILIILFVYRMATK